MRIATYSIKNPLTVWLLMLICLIGGVTGVVAIGKLEDPAFAVKTAIVTTTYPGATAEEVELEITEPLESTIQQLAQLGDITSRSLPGQSQITVEIRDDFNSDNLQQAWDELRRKVSAAAMKLPSGANSPVVNDDFGDVYGMFYAVVAEGFSDRQRQELATRLRREVLTVPGVTQAQLAGVPEETIYVEVTQEKLASLGISMSSIASVFQTESDIANAGSMRLGERRIRLVLPAGDDSEETIKGLKFGVPGTTEQLHIGDIARVYRVESESPSQVVRHNGHEAFTLAIAGRSDRNIVDIGHAVEAHLDELRSHLPLGVDILPIYEQHIVVDTAISDFLVNLAASVAIVVAVLLLVMGWRVGVVVGGTLLLTVLGTVLTMWIFEIQMERISLGALIIAMGMLVDNAIVIAESMLLSMHKGQDSVSAAEDAAQQTQYPLLAATVIGILAFAGIGLSQDTTGDFMFSLFAVICISLLLSWILAVTVTPLLGHYLFTQKEAGEDAGHYDGGGYRFYKGLLGAALRFPRITVLMLVATTAVSVMGFALVKQSFFPPSNTPIFYINYTLPQGSDIRATEADIADIEALVKARDEVVNVTSFIGMGASRFMLTYSPDLPNPSFGQLIVRTHNREEIPLVMNELRAQIRERHAQADVFTQRLFFGPATGAKIEARFKGNDSAVLRELGAKAEALMRQEPSITDVRQDWRQREFTIYPVVDEQKAKIAGLSRTDIADATEFATVGKTVGIYREDERQIPVVIRPPVSERQNMDWLRDRLIWSEVQQDFIPITQVIKEFDVQAHDGIIKRRNRVRTLTVQAEPAGDYTAEEARRNVAAVIENMPLPDGYSFEWGGEFESSRDAQKALGQQLPLSFLSMILITVLLFNAVRQALLIWFIVPMAICGVTAGLVFTGMPFSFTALLGLLSLSGMLIKNAIVLVDETDLRRKEGGALRDAIVGASLSRVRPVVLAVLTTVLGMIPLLWDAFFASMAVTIMSGLTFATLLTLVAVPVLYSLFFSEKDMGH
ncbi:efflux RND transporter permease subunit [Alteromonas sp. 1_MG-2023]|uniref:efflux RND transporter permease subunit n=1 Tax=Alteromonas sp. 1_MG-2023 TaxID=3062669 RepID=UPI0026E30A58|nr:efflux RND transporter permease subunit [Alteromonas sp. 1_MG-2023]MDO6476405.1 efflux RND transporter permease subunit [Alteromonas sp. 1_MG-2023]